VGALVAGGPCLLVESVPGSAFLPDAENASGTVLAMDAEAGVGRTVDEGCQSLLFLLCPLF